MGQQLGIMVLVDIAAAVEANDLRGHLWLVDNGGWNGSSGEGTGTLVTALDVTDAASVGAPILNWLPLGIGTLPFVVPQTAFLARQDRESLGQAPDQPVPTFTPRRRTILGDEMTARPPGQITAAALPTGPATPFAGQGFLDPGTARFLRTRHSRVARTDDQTVIYHPDPVIERIAGEAEESGAIFPAQYGSPQLFSDGLYWSASVNPASLGLFRYTLWISLSYERCDVDGGISRHTVTLPHDAWIKISTGAPRGGFRQRDLDIVSV